MPWTEKKSKSVYKEKAQSRDAFKKSGKKKNKLFSNLKYVLAVVVALVVAQVFGVGSSNLTRNLWDKFSLWKDRDTIERAVIEVAAELQKDLPQKFGDWGELASLVADGKTLRYNYKLYGGSQLHSDHIATLPCLVCKNESQAKMMEEYGIAYTYMYFSHDGSLLAHMTINNSSCGRACFDLKNTFAVLLHPETKESGLCWADRESTADADATVSACVEAYEKAGFKIIEKH
jgi:hypothetical protein